MAADHNDLVSELRERLMSRNRAQGELDQAMRAVAEAKRMARSWRDILAIEEKALREIESELLTGVSSMPLLAGAQKQAGKGPPEPEPENPNGARSYHVFDEAKVREQIRNMESYDGDGSKTWLCIYCGTAWPMKQSEGCPSCGKRIRQTALGVLEDLTRAPTSIETRPDVANGQKQAGKGPPRALDHFDRVTPDHAPLTPEEVDNCLVHALEDSRVGKITALRAILDASTQDVRTILAVLDEAWPRVPSNRWDAAIGGYLVRSGPPAFWCPAPGGSAVPAPTLQDVVLAERIIDLIWERRLAGSTPPADPADAGADSPRESKPPRKRKESTNVPPRTNP